MTQTPADLPPDAKPILNRIDASLRRHAKQEWIIVVVLVLLFLAGIVLLIIGIARQDWTISVPGGIVEMGVYFPVRQLQHTRNRNISLQVIPLALSLADTEQRKRLVFEFLNRLISQV